MDATGDSILAGNEHLMETVGRKSFQYAPLCLENSQPSQSQDNQEHKILLLPQWNHQQCWPEKMDIKSNKYGKLLIKHMLEQVKVQWEHLKREEKKCKKEKSNSQTSMLPPTNWFMTESLTDWRVNFCNECGDGSTNLSSWFSMANISLWAVERSKLLGIER
jgi:hypothetical protein